MNEDIVDRCKPRASSLTPCLFYFILNKKNNTKNITSSHIIITHRSTQIHSHLLHPPHTSFHIYSTLYSPLLLHHTILLASPTTTTGNNDDGRRAPAIPHHSRRLWISSSILPTLYCMYVLSWSDR